MSFDINDGSRKSLLEKGRDLTGETEGPDDTAYAREVGDAAEHIVGFDWEILKKRAARLQDEEEAYRAPEPAKRPWWRIAWLVPVLAGAFALLLFVKPEPTNRAKGDVELEFMVLDEGQIRPGIEGEPLNAGDQIQFTYRAPGLDTLVLLSIDGSGTLTVFHPDEGDTPLAIIPGEKHVLDGSIILDDAPGPEVFVAVFGPGTVDEATELAAAAFEEGSHDAVEGLETTDPAIATVRINKTP
jgi:hypothetical protein